MTSFLHWSMTGWHSRGLAYAVLQGVAAARPDDLVGGGGGGGVVRLGVAVERVEAGAEAGAESVFSKLSSPCLLRCSSR